MFYLTNTAANMVLSNTTLDFDSDAANLLTIGGNDANNWGKDGSNGADVTFTGLKQDLKGDIDVDTISSLDLYLLDGSSYTGATTISDNADTTKTSEAPISVNVDADSTWTVTEDSIVTNLHVAKGGVIVDEDGETATIVDGNGTVLAKGAGDRTVTVTGTYDTTVETDEANTLHATVIDRDDFDVTYGTRTTFGSNADEARNDDVTEQEPTGGDDVTGGNQPGGQPPELPDDGQGLPFTDVAKDHWAYDNILAIYKAGLMIGTGDKTFAPELALNRAMLVSILYRLDGDSEQRADSGFTDVADDAWYAQAVAWAKENNIVSGYSATTFGPDDILTREQFAAILYRYAAYKGYDTTVSDDASLKGYTDTNRISEGFEKALLWATDKGYLSGMTTTTLAPQLGTTRAQTAAILERFLNAENALPSGGHAGDNGEPVKPEKDA